MYLLPFNTYNFDYYSLYFCLHLIGRDGIYSSVPQSESTANGVFLCIRGCLIIFSYTTLTSAGRDKKQ